MTYITRFIPFSLAWFKTNANEAIVFPPPVGTVSLKNPLGFSASEMQFFKISVLPSVDST